MADHDRQIATLCQLWEQMTSLYNTAWIRTNGITPTRDDGTLSVAGDSWSRALTGLRGSQIAAGVGACVKAGREFPPSAPRFRAMCLGIPELHRVQWELQHPDEASAFTRAVWAFVDGHAYRHANADRAQQILRSAYDMAHDRAMRGEALPSAHVGALPTPEKAEPQGIPARGDSSEKGRAARENHLVQLLGELYTPPESRRHADGH